MPTRVCRKDSARPRVETLESRRLLAAFGTPWPDARGLTVSFPADGTEVVTQQNNLHATLDALAQREDWQELALRALQTWSYYADINVGLRTDANLPFGSPGLTVGDPRFGDFRFGSLDQETVLANSLPFQVTAGSFAGDVLLNSGTAFTFHDWDEGVPPLDPQAPDTFDLYSVLLHETGNALGLADTSDPSSVMFGQYSGPKGLLTADDIAAIQALYGARTDPYETFDNGQLWLSTSITVPAGFDPAEETIDVNGSLRSSSDVDFYQFQPLSGENKVRIELNASGISLLQAKLQVFDTYGQLLAETSADSAFDNDLAVTMQNLHVVADGTPLYLRVSPKDGGGVYSVGDYQLRIDYRSSTVRADDPVRGAFDGGPETLWTNFGLVDPEYGATDSVADALAMPLAPGHSAGNRYEVASSLGASTVGGPTDIDVWKVTTPAGLSGPLTVHLSGVGLETAAVRVRILDASGQPAGATGYLRSDGTWTLELAQPSTSSEYYIRVSVDPSSAVDVGNYVVSAEFAVPQAQMNQMISRTISSTVDDFVRWKADRTKLYRFDLKAQGTSTDDYAQLTIYDAHTREVAMVLSTPAGGFRTAHAMLAEGDYLLRFTAVSRTGAAIPAMDVELFCEGLSDNQDPSDSSTDPDYDPDYDSYYYYDTYNYGYDYDYDDPALDPNYGYSYYDYSS